MVGMQQAPILMFVGTHSEAIKMAPVYLALKRAGVPVFLCCFAQKDEAIRYAFDLFGIAPDLVFDAIQSHDESCVVVQHVLRDAKKAIEQINPLLLLVHGDSTSAMACALAGFYMNVPVGHVEAGLRTEDIRAPFPQEVNRRVISVVTTYHFAPTPAAVANVLAHGARRNQVFCTGNTGVDAFYLIREKIISREIEVDDRVRAWVQQVMQDDAHVALLSIERPETLEQKLEHVLTAVKEYAQQNLDVRWLFPYESIPVIAEAIARVGLADLDNVLLIDHLSYQDTVFVLDAAHIVVTDSDSLQEQAASLGKSVVVLRNKTDRMEGVLAGHTWVVGTDCPLVFNGIERARAHLKTSIMPTVRMYADGHASEKIVAFIQVRYEQLQEQTVGTSSYESQKENG